MALPLKVAFAGTPDLAATVLQSLLDDDRFNVQCVFTQPDRASGRGRKINKSPVKLLAESNDLAIHQPQNSTGMEPQLLSGIDVMIVVAYGILIPNSILEKPAMGCINVHTSLLPRWRGAAPIQRAIEAGDEITGITIMQMDSGLDTGDILLQAETPIHGFDTAGSLHDRLAELGATVLRESLLKMENGSIQRMKQDDSLSCYAAKLNRAQAEIEWHRPALEIERKIRAFNPAPVCFTHLNGLEMRIWESYVGDTLSEETEPGTVIASDNGGFAVMCGDLPLQIKKLQLPGKKPVHVDEFLNGHKTFLHPRAEG